MKKIIVTLVIITITLTACGGKNTAEQTQSDDLIVVGFSQVGAESNWRAANTKSMRDTFTKENGYMLIFADAQQKQDNQITAIRNFIQQDVDYIVIAPISETGWDTVLQEAKRAEIPVIIVDRRIAVSNDTLFTCWVGSDFYREGETAVAWMEQTLAGRDNVKIVHMQGSIGSTAQIGRTSALETGLRNNPNWEIVSKESGDFTEAKGKELMESILAGGTAVDVVYCENDNMAFGAIEAIEAAGKTVGLDGDIIIVSFDASREGLELMLKDKISIDVECSPLHGPRVAKLIRQLEAGAQPEKFSYAEEGVFDAANITRKLIDTRPY